MNELSPKDMKKVVSVIEEYTEKRFHSYTQTILELMGAFQNAAKENAKVNSEQFEMLKEEIKGLKDQIQVQSDFFNNWNTTKAVFWQGSKILVMIGAVLGSLGTVWVLFKYIISQAIK